MEIAEKRGWDWVPIYDNPNMVVFGDNRKFTNSPYAEWYDTRDRSVSHDVWLHFKRTVPEEIQEVVGRQFRYSQIQLVKALRHCPELIYLARSCPPLFWLIVEKNSDVNILNSWNFTRLVRSPRPEILSRLGYIGTKSAIKLLSKIEIDYFRDEDLFHLKDIMISEEKISLLRHYKVLSKTHLFAAANYPRLLKYTFVRNELSRNDLSLSAFKQLASLCDDTCNMAQILRWGNIEDFLNSIRSPQQLERRHDDLVMALHNEQVNTGLLKDLLQIYGNDAFPPPPVPGGDAIQPITSLHELAREGLEMQNCILTYAHRIFENRFFCYKILKPERATLGLEFSQGTPVIADARLKKNSKPSHATFRVVEEWLDMMQKAQAASLESEKEK